MSDVRPFFSIIIPAFNAEKVVARMISSVLAQTFRDYEVLFMDGASTDNTISLIRSFADSRIQVFSERDEGIYDAMNKGLAKATGQWIYFSGCDDRLSDENVLRDVAGFIESGTYDFVYGNVDSELLGHNYDGEFTVSKILNKNICHQSIFVARDTFRKLGAFNAAYKICADWDFNLRAFLNPQIRTGYFERTISDFSSGGVSSVSKVDEFVRNRKQLIIRYGWDVLPERVLKRYYSSRFLYWRDRVKRFFERTQTTRIFK